ncbi:c-type cytochrome [Psychromarinibacter halotolerans]|uniref:C-type cytochrome n=2 Tax=Psychromarinibacter halotolerans TaxID=1775175 RepID=A0ABV7GXC6_9RHOB|nr:c-type cytochrome [Psychromarinibacter halotolerans]MAQ83129.1 cytochrome C [Maritimibacter sp.]MDF0598021.1 cytochrome C [Psychromarinibacter halotolerans]
MRATSSLVALIGLAALGACTPETDTGESNFMNLCAGCHGDDGRGTGPAAVSLDAVPADLTLIAARNGGRFPMVEVMSKIDGYAKGEEHHGAMPAFWPLLEGRTVLVQTGDGILTPTPEPLVELAEYIRSIQRDGTDAE